MKKPALPLKQPALPALDQEAVELNAVAHSLGLTAQSLWNLIEQQGLEVLRLQSGGRTWSALTRMDQEHLSAHVRGVPAGREPQLDAGRDAPEPLMERVREAEERSVALEEALLELRSRVVQSRQHAREARQQMSALRGRFERELAASQAQLMDRASKLERLSGRRRSLQVELDRSREGHAGELVALQTERDGLLRQLAMASEIERAHNAYLDRHERLDRYSA